MRAIQAASPEEIAELRAQGEPFWLDLREPSVVEEVRRLAVPLGLSQAVVEDLTRFGQRPRLARHGNESVLVLYGARLADGNPEVVEVHALLTQGCLLSVHQVPIVEIRELQQSDRPDSALGLKHLLAALIDSLMSTLEAVDDEIDDLEDVIIDEPAPVHMRRLTELRRGLVDIRHAASPQRDLFLREADELSSMPGLSMTSVREVYARLVLVRDLVDSTRDLASGALDLYLSTTSNRLALVGERLTIIATVLLPLVVIAGFFGQNFGWLVTRIDSFAAFAIFGVGGPLFLIVGIFLYMRHRGYV